MSHRLHCDGTGNNKLSYRRDSARCVKRPFSASRGRPLLCKSTRHISLIALNSNLTSIFYRSLDITTPIVCIYPYTTSVPGGTGKRLLGLGGHVLVSECPEHGLSSRKLKSIRVKVHRMITMHAHPRQTDEHHGNSATICSNERIAR